MAESTWWDEEFDVVVAGGGAAGLMAAVEAADGGASVLLVEKQPDVGAGATGMCIGSISAAGTALQRAAGIDDDTTDAHFDDLLKFLQGGVYQSSSDDFDLELTRLMIDIAPGVIERLTELGVEFSGPHPEPPHSVYRMHNVVPNAGAYIETLRRAATERGVTIRTETVIDELRRDESGAVSMISLRHVRRGETKAVSVRRAVVLAAGDFSANDELARAHGRTPEVSAVEPIQPNATGDGLLLAMDIGAEAVGLDRGGGAGFRTVLAPYVAPDGGLFREGAILVNKLGRRFGNELERREIALAANDQPDHHAYIIFDARVAGCIATAADDHPPSRDGWYRTDKLFLGTFPGVAYAYLEDFRGTDYFYEGGTIRELADQAGLPVDVLAEEAEQFSAAATAGSSDRFGRDPIGPGVSEPPFYAVGPIHPIITFSAGGLRVDNEMHVLDGDERPIPHLYSCGANAEARVFLGGHGSHLAWAFGTGAIAGTNAAGESVATAGAEMTS